MACMNLMCVCVLFATGPTDLSMKTQQTSTSVAGPTLGAAVLGLGAGFGLGASLGGTSLFRPLSPPSAAQATTLKAMIAGFREAAAYLYRSAEELEQVLLASGDN